MVYERFAQIGYPQQRLEVFPAELQREYRKALDTLLSRVEPVGTEAATRTAMSPAYVGDADAAEALAADLVGALRAPSAVGTCLGHWESWTGELRCVPPPPERVELIAHPGADLREDGFRRARRFLEGRTLRIVGSRPERGVLGRFEEELGVAATGIDWLASEKHKRPNVKRAWANLGYDRDVAICVTGRVAHCTSDAAEKAARRGVLYLEVESAARIPDVRSD